MRYAKVKKVGGLLIGTLSALISTPLLAQSSAQSLPEAQSNQPDSPREKWFVTAKQCQVLLPDQFILSVEWTGNCLNGLVDGPGLLTVKAGVTEARWSGSMQNGMAQGNGLATYLQGSRVFQNIEGVWINNRLDRGTSTWWNGSKYVGNFKNGLPHGSHGTYYFPNGDEYSGDFEGGLFSGLGAYRYKGGGVYSGGWKAGKKEGYGFEISPTGQILHMGAWANGQAVATPNNSRPPSSYGCAENGSCYGDISPLTGNPKTIHVDGYFRSDGTYVRGHFRGKGN